MVKFLYGVQMLDKKIIKDFNNSPVSYEDFISIAKNFDSNGYSTFIGTDSQHCKMHVSIVTSICFHNTTIGGSKIFYIKEKKSKSLYPTLRSRMLDEAYRSVEVAIELDKILNGQLTVHLDIGDDVIKNKTSKFNKELQMLVKGQGFDCAIKPDSWASTTVADKLTKN